MREPWSADSRARTITRVPRRSASSVLCVTNRIVVPVASHKLADQLLHAAARAGVERAEGFVHQQNPRLRHQRLRDRHALLHAAGKLVAGICLASLFAQTDALQVVESLLAELPAAPVERGVRRPNRLNSLTSGPKVMLSSTVLSGNSEYFCGT